MLTGKRLCWPLMWSPGEERGCDGSTDQVQAEQQAGWLAGRAVPRALIQQPGDNCARGMALLRCLHSLIGPVSVNNVFVSSMAVTKKLCKCSVRLAWTSCSKVNHFVRALGSPLEKDRRVMILLRWESYCALFQLISTNISFRDPMLSQAWFKVPGLFVISAVAVQYALVLYMLEAFVLYMS